MEETVGRVNDDDFVLRRADFSLSDEQDALQAAFRTFFERECSSERVRAAEPLGWDPELWDQLQDLRPTVMGVAGDRGGDDAGLVELAIVAEEVGRHAAPVPVVETMVAARLLCAVDHDLAHAALARVVAGEVASVAVARATTGRQLVPAAAVAPMVVGLRDDALVLLTGGQCAAPVANLASAPVAWCDLADGVEIMRAVPARAAFARAADEWRILTAAALVGLGDAALRLGVQYAKDRHAFGAPIGSFQAIAHPLVDAATGIEGARRLVHRAAWFADHEPEALGGGPSSAYVYAAESAERAGDRGAAHPGWVRVHAGVRRPAALPSRQGLGAGRGGPPGRVASDRRAPGRRGAVTQRSRGMNFSPMPLDADTIEFWNDVRAFFDEHVTEEVHELERRTGGGFNEELHLAMGARGWVAPSWPTREGGAGLDAVRAAIVARELRRSGAPAILAGTTLLPAVSIRAHGSEQLKREVLPGIANGTIRICLGYTEPDAGSDLAAVRTRAVRDGDEWLVQGQKMFTTGAQFCQYCFLLARTNPDVAKHKGLTVFLVPLDLPGIEVRGIGTVGGERTNFVHYDEVRVPDHFRLGPVDGGWAVVSEPLAQEHGVHGDRDLVLESPAMYTETTRRLLGTVIEELRDAVDDAGRPRLEDPSVRERLGRVALDIEASDLTPGPMGRIISAETLVRDASDLLELLGPAGQLGHGADGAVCDGYAEYAFRFAPGTRIYGGSTDIHRNLVAEQLLGLPRSTPRG